MSNELDANTTGEGLGDLVMCGAQGRILMSYLVLSVQRCQSVRKVDDQYRLLLTVTGIIMVGRHPRVSILCLLDSVSTLSLSDVTPRDQILVVGMDRERSYCSINTIMRTL